MAIYFTSDTHFGHPAILKLSRRPFASLAEMDAALNGEVHLIVGNHDGGTLKRRAGSFASVNQISEIGVNGKAIVLCHYPMREWHGCWRGAWHLYGHVHGRLNHRPLGHSLDVGVDSNGFRPWRLEDIEALFAARRNPFTGERPQPVKKTIREP